MSLPGQNQVGDDERERIACHYKVADNWNYMIYARRDPSHFWTPDFDARYPNMKQTRVCYQNFVDFHRCRKQKGADYEPCDYFKYAFENLCPNFWTKKWYDQMEAGTFPDTV